MNTKKYIYLIMALAMAGSFALIAPALADNNQLGQNSQRDQGRITNPGWPDVFGTVSAVNGNTITITGKQGPDGTTTTTTFTINDATNAKVIKNGVASSVSSVVIGDTIIVQGTVTGTNIVPTMIRDGKINQGEMNFGRMMPSVVGKVSAINGNTLTVISKQGFNKTTPNATTTFTVDATNAKVLRGGTESTVSNIAIGDTIIVQGTVTGTNVVATTIRDGKMSEGDNNKALMQIQGNGQPVVAGTISAINGSTFTITNNGIVAYTIDATGAKIIQGNNTISLSGLKIGDSVIVQGTVNGASVTASTVIDQAKIANTTVKSELHWGFFGSIGQFFKHLFGF